MRKLARLLPYLALVLVPVVGLVVILGSGPLAEHLRKAIQTEFSDQLDRDVTIGSASLALSGRVTLRDVVVRNRDGSPFITAPTVSARVGREGSWLPLLSGPTEVREVKLVEPEVALTRDASGKWSVEDLAARQQEKPSRFRGNVLVEDGRLVFTDAERGGATTVLQDVDLTLRYPEQGRSVFSLRARGEEGAFARLEAEGESDAETGVTRVAGSVSELDIPYALARLPEVSALAVAAGQGDVRGELVLGNKTGPQEGVSYDVEVTVRDGEVSFPWLRRPVEGVSGKLRFVDGDVHLAEMAGTVTEAPVSAEGVISDLHNPALALDFTMSGIRYPQLRALFPKVALPLGLALPSPIRMTGRAEGLASEVRVTGEARVRVIKFRAIPWNDLVGRFEYSQGRLEVTGLAAHGSPRRLEGEGVLDWRTGQRKFEGTIGLAEVPVAVLAQMAGLDRTDLAGTASLTVRAQVDGKAVAAGEFQVHDAAVGDVRLGTVTGEFEFADGRITVRRGTLSGPLGRGTFEGWVSLDGPFEVEAQFSSLDLGTVAATSGQPGLAGSCAATIGASGNTGALEASGRAEFGPGEVEGRRFDRVAVRFALSPLTLRFSDVEAAFGAGEYRGRLEVTNWLAGQGRARMNGELQVEGALLGDWLPPQYAKVASGGEIEGVIRLWGRVGDPAAEADLTLEAPTVVGQPFEGGRIHLRYEAGRLAVEEMFLRNGDMYVVVTGGCDARTGLDLTVSADPFDVVAVAPNARSRYGLAVAGRIRGGAQLRGAPTAPTVTFHVEGESLVVNGEPVQEVAVSGEWRDSILEVTSGLLRADAGVLHFSGVADGGRRTLDISVQVQELDVGRAYAAGYLSLWRLHRSGVESPHFASYARVPHPLEGRVSANLGVAGPWDEPEVSAQGLVLEGLGYAGRRITRVAGDVSVRLALDGNGPAVREATVNLVASDEMGDAEIRTEVGPDGELSLVVDSLGYIDLSLLGPWLQYPLGIEGRATINFDIKDPFTRPVVQGDVLVDQLKLGPFKVEQAAASPIRVETGVLTVEGIRFTNPPVGDAPRFVATGSAELPLYQVDAEAGAARAPARRAELHITNASVPLLHGMAPGLFNADVYLEGNRILLGDGRPREAGGSGAGIEGRLGEGRFAIWGDVVLAESEVSDWREHRFNLACELDGAELSIPGMVSATLDGTLLLTNERDPQEVARDAGFALLGTPLAGMNPMAPFMTAEMQQELRGKPRAVLSTHTDRPLVLSEPKLSVSKVGLPPSAPDAAGPRVDVTALLGRVGAGVEDGQVEPTPFEVDLGVLNVKGLATGELRFWGELTPDAYALDAEARASEGLVVFPNAALVLRSGTVHVNRRKGGKPVVRISEAEAVGRVGDYSITLRPAGQVYPLDEADSEVGAPLQLLPLNAMTIPYLDPYLAAALLWGPVVAPTRGAGRSGEVALAEPGAGARGTGEITGLMIPALGRGSGMPELSLDVTLQGPVRMRLGERILSRMLITYVSPVSGPEGARSLGITYEIVPPLLSIGWSVDELERTRWELQAFRSF